MVESLRQLKERARLDLHQAMQVAALYLVENPNYVVPVVDPDIPRYLETPVNVRVHYEFGALGDLIGTNIHFAERQEIKPELIFLRSEIDDPQRHAVVSVSPDEAWRIDNVEPPDTITVKCQALRLSAAQIAMGGYPYPPAPTPYPVLL